MFIGTELLASDDWSKCDVVIGEEQKDETLFCLESLDLATQTWTDVTMPPLPCHTYEHLANDSNCWHMDVSYYRDGFVAPGGKMNRVGYYMTICNNTSRPIYTLATSWKVTPAPVIHSLFVRDMRHTRDGFTVTDYNRRSIRIFHRFCMMQGDLMEMSDLIGTSAPRGHHANRRSVIQTHYHNHGGQEQVSLKELLDSYNPPGYFKDARTGQV